MPELREWSDFYVIVGSSAGALIGLQFVVMTLIADRPPERVADVNAAFSTPTVVHFGGVLLLAALVAAPWTSVGVPAALWAAEGLGGVAYVVATARRMRAQSVYRPEAEDWVFFVVLPAAGYLVLSASGIAALSHPHDALFGVGAAALLLLFVGIHNAWDSVAYLVAKRRTDDEAEGR
jgi:hypothetical protein